ncbi:MAG TPA: DUF6600 domain-containing protein [Silvibacterium sp.]|nr:DUF6600 domain-containing protein [Silvibacterium sp.]
MCLTASGWAVAQDVPPPPPADAPPSSIQEPAPEASVRAVRLSEVQGTVHVLQDGEEAFSQAQLNMPVVEGMRLVAGEDGRVEIQFEDGSVARLTPNSSLTLTRLGRDAGGDTQTIIGADSGLSYYELNGRAGQYTVRFGQDNIVPVDSSTFRVDLDQAPAELAVTHGGVQVSDGENLSAELHTNQTMQFDAQNPDEYQLVQSVSANSWDQWNSDRDEALSAMDESATSARASTGNPDNPAWSDLDANGDWYSVPGYGMGWTPSGVGEDWDPYGDGSWAYYNDVGYTWISDYSWGWWPYRCGAWSWFEGFGWMWFPGNCGWGGVDAAWYPYGVIWRHPPGYHCPRRPKPVPLPVHGPVRHQPLIAVNRGPQRAQQFRTVGVAKAAPRVFHYDGQTIAPVESLVRPRVGGPLGEGFTSSLVRTHPEVLTRGAIGNPGYQPSRPMGYPYQSGRGYSAPPASGRVYAAPSRPAPSGGGRVAAPPPAAVHAAPAPAAPAAHSHR